MDTSLSLTSLTALATVMTLGALIPGLSTLTVAARAATSGFRHGLLTTAGIVLGDLIFIVIAMFGLSLLADTLGDHFVLIHYLGGVYLMGLGLLLWRSRPAAAPVAQNPSLSLAASFMSGLLLTLADQKAILFYLGFFPALIDLPRLTRLDAGLILLIAVFAVGLPKLFYAALAVKAGRVVMRGTLARALNLAMGSVLIGVGILVVLTI
ncbi:MAG: LysE family translocator [Gammaproteobacteria bacterium]